MTNTAAITKHLKSTLQHTSAEALGSALRGFGVNILVHDALTQSEQYREILGFEIIRAEKAFALLVIPQYAPPEDSVYLHQILQIHADFTYHNNPYLNHLPELGPRGLGAELHLFETDPDACVARATAHDDWTVLQEATDKPHGVREAYLLDGMGYCWVVSSPL